MPDLQDAKRFIVIDPDADDAVVELCMAAAVQALEAMGVRAPSENSALYDMAVYQLAAHYHQHRADGTDTAIPPGVMALMHQLRGEEEQDGQEQS